jgi:hypothetical protein
MKLAFLWIIVFLVIQPFFYNLYGSNSAAENSVGENKSQKSK